MRIRTIASVAAAAILTVETATVPVAAQSPYGRIVVFGTSLSDPGNAFALTGAVNTAPDYLNDAFLVPSAQYARGGHHFSNGATWSEQFARSMALAGNARPAFRETGGEATNYAVGGARAREDGINVNLSRQVSAFLQQSGGVAPADALYVIEMGGNDIRDALVVYAQGGNGAPILQAANLAIANEIGTLYAAGARNFLVWRAPNVGLTPAVRSLGTAAVQLGTALTLGFNAGLDGVVTYFQQFPGISIARLDAYAILSDLVTRPERFGLTDVVSACITPDVAPYACDRPDEFLFWDGIHPTVAVHTILSQQAASAVAR
jgi:phospholipase/lecithinase/hemolysin